MANKNPIPRTKIGTARTVKLTLSDVVWDRLEKDEVSSKMAEKLRVVLEKYYGVEDRSS